MARQSPEQLVRRIRAAIRGWETKARHTTLSRHTLSQFKAAMQPALEAHARVLDQRKDLRLSIIERDSAVGKALELVYLVGFAAKGHPEHGPNSDLCAALGYTWESVRRAKIRRARRRRRTDAKER